MMKNYIFLLNKFSSFVYYFFILLFIISFNFAHNPPTGWYQQFLPNLNGAPITDITFVDSLTGYCVTNEQSINDTDYILKTIDGGNNWGIVRKASKEFVGFNRILFLNLQTGYVTGVGLDKTSNGGLSWVSQNVPNSALVYNDMSILSEDTIWLAAQAATSGGLFKTTNGGINWVRQFGSAGSGNPDKVYFYNKEIGFISYSLQELRRTTNGGETWTLVDNALGFSDMYFADSLIGWKANEGIEKTTDGGLTWVTLNLPPKGTPTIYNGNIILSRIRQFSNIDKDTIWGVGSSTFFGAGRFRGLIYKSTNGGDTWGYQIPDTSINITTYSKSDFADAQHGWAYTVATGVHTVTGGDSVTIYTKINTNSENVPENFVLNQNYPNPFNPNTIISYILAVSGNISLKVFDIKGKEIRQLVNKKQNSGTYEIKFEGSQLSSGIYFYSLLINGEIMHTKKMILVR